MTVSSARVALAHVLSQPHDPAGASKPEQHQGQPAHPWFCLSDTGLQLMMQAVSPTGEISAGMTPSGRMQRIAVRTWRHC